MPDYPMLRPEQVNPWNAALKQAFATYGEGLKAAFAKPSMEQALLKSQQENIWNPQIWQSEIGLRDAQAGLAGSEAQKNRFLVNNPQYISPEGMLITQSMRQNGYQGGNTPQPNGRIGNSAVTPLDQQNIDTMQPGQSYVIGSGQAPGNYGQQSAPQGQPPQQGQPQQAGARAQMPTAEQYDQNAMAFNPPQLPSPTGNPNLDNLWFKKFGMSPLLQAQLDLSTKQAEKYQDQSIDRNKEFNEQATFANQSTIDAYKFLNALDRVSGLETGYPFGKAPGLRDAAQEMDTYGNNLAASASQLFQQGHAIHKSDITLMQMAKPNRVQNPDVSFDLAQGIIAKNDRLKERQLFYSLGTQMHLKPEVLDAQWNKYETQRPYMDSDTKMPNDAYKGTWKDYLTPQSINSFVKGSDFKQPNQKALQGLNWREDDLKSIQDWAYKNHFDPKDFSKRNLYAIAKHDGISLSQLKSELMKRGGFK